MKKLESSKTSGILAILAFIFNIIIFAPIEIFYTNKQELWFEIKDILAVVVTFALIIIGALLLILKLINKNKRHIFVKIIIALTIGLYIQGNFLNFGYARIDEMAINWNDMIIKGIINTIVWLGIIIFPFCIKKFKDEKFLNKFTSIVSLTIILIQVSTLSILILNNKNSNKKTIGLVNENIFNFSKENNIVVIMSDTFEGKYMNIVLDRLPQFKEKLKDFIYFNNCTGANFFTFSSMPMLLTGEECVVGKNLQENIEHTFNKTEMYKILEENNYSSELYLEEALQPNISQIDNLKEYSKETTLKTKIKLTEKMYKYVLFRYLPHFLKPNFTLSSQEFNNVKKENHLLEYKEKTYFLDDVEFNKELLKNGIETTASNNIFKFYQMNGVHYPYNTTPEIVYDESVEYEQLIRTDTRKYNEQVASLNLLCNYIEELKKAGVYDNTTIIFLADHGYDNRFWTTLLVKKANADKEFEINRAPVSLLEDLTPTILNIATNTKDYGKDFFDYSEGERRIRRVHNYVYQTDIENSYTIFSKLVFETEGPAKEEDAFYIVSEEYENDDKELTEKYEFGEKMDIDQIRSSNKIKTIGFAFEDIGYRVLKGSNISNVSKIIINANKTNNNIKFDLDIKKVFGSEQTIILKVNGKEITRKKVNMFLNKTVSFYIDKELWNEKEQVEITLEFPDAKLGTYHESTMTAIQMKSINFTQAFN